MVYITRILLSSEKTGERKAITPKTPIEVSDLSAYRKEIREKYADFDNINFIYDEENT